MQVYVEMASVQVSVTCLGLCPDSHCLLVDVTDGPRVLIDCPIEALGMQNFPVVSSHGGVGASVVGG